MKRKHLANFLPVLASILIFIWGLFAFAKLTPERTLTSAIQIMQNLAKQGAQFSEIEEAFETAKDGKNKIRVFKGYFKAQPDSPHIYFEYRLPPNYQGVDAVEAAGFSKDSSYWLEPNEKARLLESGYGVVTFDGWVRGRSLSRYSNRHELPHNVFFHGEAQSPKALVVTLGLNDVVIIGHSRGGGIAAKMGEMILDENGPTSKKPIRIVSFYDLNGLVSYVTRDFPKNTFSVESDPKRGFINERFNKRMEDGQIAEVKINSPLEYHHELLSQWKQFQREYLDRPSVFNATFVADIPNLSDEWNPYAKELSAEQFNELLLKFPLLIQPHGRLEKSNENYFISHVSNKSQDPSFDSELDVESLRAMLRGSRIVFRVSQNGVVTDHCIPLSPMSAYDAIIKAGIPTKFLYGPDDNLIRKQDFALKKSLFSGLPNVEFIRDDAGKSNGYTSHFGANRPIWEETVAPKIRGHLGPVSCRRTHR